ncbi:MAG TPA: FAD-dependent oxidoreductase [Capillimicrobium sp.]|nr:FAD-dependent oxidoreductase [Capillimicrobium sp.]
MDEPVDVLVAGAGAIGLAVAWRAAQRGLRVRVVERAHAGAGASTAAAGILAPSRPEEWLGERGAANLRAIAAWPAFAAELEDAAGMAIGLRRDGTLRVARDEAGRAAIDVAAQALAEADVEHAVLDADGVAAEEPGVRGAVAGLLVPGDAHVATDRLVDALARACEGAGVRLTEGVAVAGTLAGPGGAVAGVRLADGTKQAAALTVAATGAWSGGASWLPEPVRPDVRPLAGEYLILCGPPVCRRVVRTLEGSIVPRDGGRLWVGTTVRDAGFEERPRAAAIAAILGHWTSLLPAVGALEVERVGIGLRPGTPDGRPLVGPSGVPGVALATGHGREGIIHAPLAGAAIAELAASAA